MQKNNQNKVTLNPIDKETKKNLEEIAAVLPDVTPIVIKGGDAINRWTREELDGFGFPPNEDIKLGDTYKVTFFGHQSSVNHLKRITSLYRQGGWEAVDKYCEPYKLKPEPTQPQEEEKPQPKKRGRKPKNKETDK